MCHYATWADTSLNYLIAGISTRYDMQCHGMILAVYPSMNATTATNQEDTMTYTHTNQGDKNMDQVAYWNCENQRIEMYPSEEQGNPVPYVEVDKETVVDHTTRLSFSIRVF